jgi:hypothetical protein
MRVSNRASTVTALPTAAEARKRAVGRAAGRGQGGLNELECFERANSCHADDRGKEHHTATTSPARTPRVSFLAREAPALSRARGINELMIVPFDGESGQDLWDDAPRVPAIHPRGGKEALTLLGSPVGQDLIGLGDDAHRIAEAGHVDQA